MCWLADFVRLIQDPTVTQIELVGDLLFSNDIFPPENAHDISKGINVSHEVCCVYGVKRHHCVLDNFIGDPMRQQRATLEKLAMQH